MSNPEVSLAEFSCAYRQHNEAVFGTELDGVISDQNSVVTSRQRFLKLVQSETQNPVLNDGPTGKPVFQQFREQPEVHRCATQRRQPEYNHHDGKTDCVHGVFEATRSAPRCPLYNRLFFTCSSRSAIVASHLVLMRCRSAICRSYASLAVFREIALSFHLSRLMTRSRMRTEFF